MKIRQLIPMFFLFALVSCQGNKVNNKSQETTNLLQNEHNASNSLDWAGTYKGVLPCADCEGIETILSLMPDNTYELSSIYLGKETEAHTQTGAFDWDETGNVVLLSGITGGSNRYFVGENTLSHLDMDGNKISGNLAEHYVLHKAVQSEETIDTQGLTGVKWELIEIFGQKLQQPGDNNNAPYLVFEENNHRIFGSGGCNQFNGSYEADEFRMSLTGLATTMKACQDMLVEQQFFQAMNDCDNYTLADGILSLNKARMAPMARLKAVKPDQ